MTLRLRATVEYDGTDFHGFQRQKNARSVQSVLEEALSLTCEEAVGIVGAGRTDTGVHAAGQVIVFNTTWSHSITDLHKALNMRLPDDVAVLDLMECEGSFHPRFSARSRIYEYVVSVLPVRHPLTRRYTWQITSNLDLDLMNEASGILVGEHDFAAFGSAPQGDVTVRRVVRAGWQAIERTERTIDSGLLFTIEANAFLFRMVRHIVLVLVQVGRKKIEVDSVRDILASKDSQRIKGMAPACGLSLVKVIY